MSGRRDRSKYRQGTTPFTKVCSRCHRLIAVRHDGTELCYFDLCHPPRRHSCRAQTKP